MFPVQVRQTVAVMVAGVLTLGTATAAAQQEDISLDLGGPRLLLRRVPKGSFTQGSPAGEIGRESDEVQRQVTLSIDIDVGKYPVTRGQFARFVQESGYKTEAEQGTSGGFGWNGQVLVQQPGFNWKTPGFSQTDEHPVTLVTFKDAQAFITWAGKKTGRRLRLPTEAEFEYAARANTQTPWYGGATEASALQIGWFKSNSPGGGTRPVGQKAPNAFGLFDMSGNVYEWCSDFHAPYPPGPASDPVSVKPPPGSEPARNVLRGGSWLKDPVRGRSAARYRNTPGSRNADNGFRVVADLGPPLVEQAGSAGSTPATKSATGKSDDGGAGTVVAIVLGFLGVVALPLGILAIILVALRKSKSVPPRTPSVFVTAYPAQDGFWLRARGPSAGTRVQYHCVMGANQRRDEVMLSGGQDTFVYTGATPNMVNILAVIEPQRGVAQAGGGHGGGGRGGGGGVSGGHHQAVGVWGAVHDSSWHNNNNNTSSEPFAGYPSAY
ncbi:formylglycine-generating enzyme family protein [Chondromyces crocatus]|nr:SUMF1/EgtB/PvdO family nonheme iron enzyme [Chondromyces crocatus]